MNKFNQLSVKSTIAIGTIFLLFSMAAYIGYTQFSVSSDMAESGQYLKGDFFDKLKKIKDENINFSNVTKNMDQTFHLLTDTRDIVLPVGVSGRENPFVR